MSLAQFMTCGLAGVACLSGAVATAQQAPPSVAADGPLQEVVVTAEKRESTVQSTPISMTAISGDQLQAQGITGLLGIISEVPGISMRTAGPGQTELEMRGLSSSGGSSPTTGFYLDETALSPSANSAIGKVVIDPDLFDLNRVEVLRGPQGTLYGSGSMGGTVKLVTNQPNLDKTEGALDATLSGTRGGGTNPGVNAMYNLPLIDDKLALRVVATEKYTSGWIDRDVVADFPYPVNPCPSWGTGCTRGNVLAEPVTQRNSDVNWENLSSGRASLLYKPSDALSIDVFGLFQQTRMGGYSEYDDPPGAAQEAHYEPFNIEEPFADKFSLAGVNLNYDLGFARLTSASAYWTRSEAQTQDASEALESFFAAIFGGGEQFVPISFYERDHSKQYSEELRLASTGDSALQWIGGAYFSKLKSVYETYNANPEYAPFSVGVAAANPDGIVYQSYDPYFLTQFAVFGEANYQIAAAWKATVGLRAYEFRAFTSQPASGIVSASGNATETSAAANSASSSNNGLTPKVNLAYEPTGDLTVYGTIAKGVRPGGPNIPISPTLGCALSSGGYSPDSVWNYEVGEKARLDDRRFTINSDFFYIDWKNVQQFVTQSCGVGQTVNVGEAHSYGPEIELAVQLTDHLVLNATGTHTHAAISSVNPYVQAQDPTLTNGFPILNIPDYTETTTLSYVYPFGKDKQFTASINNSYVGTSTDVSFYYQELQPYDIIKLRLGVKSATWDMYVFADNLTNKHAELTINTTALSYLIPSLTRVATNQPLTAGIEASFHF